jgi:hypothetical protein
MPPRRHVMGASEGSSAAGVGAMFMSSPPPATARGILARFADPTPMCTEDVMRHLDALARLPEHVDVDALEAVLTKRLDAGRSALPIETADELLTVARLVTRLGSAPSTVAEALHRSMRGQLRIEPDELSTAECERLRVASHVLGPAEQPTLMRAAIAGLPSKFAVPTGLQALDAEPEWQHASIALGLLAHPTALHELTPAQRAKVGRALQVAAPLAGFVVSNQLRAAHPFLGTLEGPWLEQAFADGPEEAIEIVRLLLVDTPENVRDGLARIDKLLPAAKARAQAHLSRAELGLIEAFLDPAKFKQAAAVYEALRTPTTLAKGLEALAASGAAEAVGISRFAVDVARALAPSIESAPTKERAASLVARLLMCKSTKLGGVVVDLLDDDPRWQWSIPASSAPLTKPSRERGLARVFEHHNDVREAREIADLLVSGLPREMMVENDVDTEVVDALPRLASRPDLQVLAAADLVDELLQDRASRGASTRRWQELEAAIEQWRGTTGAKEHDVSKRVRMREAAIAAASVPLLILDAALGSDFEGSVPREHFRFEGPVGALAHAPKIFGVLGERDTAVTADRRRPVLTGLATLATMSLRAINSPSARAVIRSVLATAGEGTAKEFGARLQALANDLERRFPAPQARANEARDRVQGALGNEPGAASVLRAVTRWAATFEAGVESAALDRLIDTLESGTLDETRRASLVPARFDVDDVDAARLPDIFRELCAGDRATPKQLLGRPSRHGLAEVVDEGGAHAWARAVDDIRSCQSTDRPTYNNRGLMNRFEDGAVRLFAVRDTEGKTRARAAARLVSLRNEGRAALFVDRCYHDATSPEARAEAQDLMAELALRRGDMLGVPVLFANDAAAPYDEPMPRHAEVELTQGIAPDYMDVGGIGVVVPGDRVRVLVGQMCVHEPTPRVVRSARALGIELEGDARPVVAPAQASAS